MLGEFGIVVMRSGARPLVALLVVMCASSLFAQEASLGELARQARQRKQSEQTGETAGQDSFAEQVRKAVELPASTPAVVDSNSLGERARQISFQRTFDKNLFRLRRPAVPHFEIAVAPPPGYREAQVVARAKKPDRGATPAGQSFSLSKIIRPSTSSREEVPPSATPSQMPPTASVRTETRPISTAAASVPPQPPHTEGVPSIVAADKRPDSVEPAKPVVPLAPSQTLEAATVEVNTASAPLPPQPAAIPEPKWTETPQTAANASTPLPDAVNIQTEFKVKYVAKEVVYLSGGRSSGLAQGMKLSIKRPADGVTAGASPVLAELEVSSVAASSAVAEIKNTTDALRVGDIAYLSEADAEALVQSRAIGEGRKYPQVIAFTEGTDPLEEEIRDEVPRPPLQEINRARGRIGLDYSGISSRGSVTSSSSQIGGVARADITRIGGTYWNLGGYWRGRFTSSSYDGQTTLQDLLNRTYHLSLTYDNPKGSWVAGFGRLYLPWASSLDTLDGGYVGRRLGHGATAGVFAGSTPDPTSWDYNPDRRIAGTFINFEGGNFENVRYTSTSGVALSTLGWVSDRPFVFFENGIFFKRYISIYQSAQADDPRPAPGATAAGPGLSRSYVTLRIQPHRRIAFDINHNYFRDVPTFSQQLISTGLVDKFLFKGFSAGVRVEPVRHVTLYTDLGLSSRTGDVKNSINQLYGITWDHIWKTGLRADVRASKFDGTFGSGTYRSLSLSRNIGDRLHWQVQAGRQNLTSSLTGQGESNFLNSSVDATFGRHYFLQADYTTQRGVMFDYDQWIFTFGYRFDNRSKIGGVQ